MVGLLVDGQWRTHHQWRHRVLSYARDLLHECNILFQIQQLHIAEGLRRSYNDLMKELCIFCVGVKIEK